jgi:hypothetical protein
MQAARRIDNLAPVSRKLAGVFVWLSVKQDRPELFIRRRAK